ncbi:MAG: hypothetical protein KME47_09975 [Nodosilinea sp. WJT8-NPBG4]|jgi:hypothetical protein|nr:hypothetical protein [Nodosilinea sp. WJT8-NPBG4]
MQPIQLSPEKQFIQRNLEISVEKMNEAQAKEMLLKVHYLMLCKDQVTVNVMKKETWGSFNGIL